MSRRKRWAKIWQLLKQVSLFRGNKYVPQYVSAGEPTVTLMKPSEARSFNQPGKKISYIAPCQEREDIEKAVIIACGMSMTGRAKLTLGDESVIYDKGEPVEPSHRFDCPLNSTIQVGLEEKADGTPVVVIITDTPEMPTFQIKHVVRERFQEEKPAATPPGHHVFLEAPCNDEQIIKALTLASSRLLNQKHTGFIEKKSEADGYKKPYNDFHLMVCLFFYIYVNELYADGSFYNSQRSQFHKYCCDHLSKDCVTNTKRYFTGCINNLETKGFGFEKYIRIKEKPFLKQKTGEQDLTFWYSIYCKAAISFDEVLNP